MRTATSRTYVNPDGTYTAELSPESVNYQDTTGTWQPIDDTLVPSSLPGYAYQNSANRYTAYFPSRLDENPIRFELGEDWMTFALVGASPTPAQVTGSTATYTAAIGGTSMTSGADTVSYSAAPDELQESIILSGATSVAAFSFKVRMSLGLLAVQDGHGGVEFREGSPAGEVVFSFAPMGMYDSAPDPAVSNGVSVTLLQDGDGVTIEAVADPTWLLDPARVYPVVIDPTVTVSRPSDCYIGSGNTEVNTSLCSQNPSKDLVGFGSAKKRRTLILFPGPRSRPAPRSSAPRCPWTSPAARRPT